MAKRKLNHDLFKVKNNEVEAPAQANADASFLISDKSVAKIASLNAQINALTQSNSNLANENAQLLDKLNEYIVEVTDLKAALDKKQATIKNTAESATINNTELQQLQVDYDNLKIENMRLERKIAELKTELQNAKTALKPSRRGTSSGNSARRGDMIYNPMSPSFGNGYQTWA